MREERSKKKRNRPARGRIFFFSRNIKDAQTSQNNVYPPVGLDQPSGRLRERFDQELGTNLCSLPCDVDSGWLPGWLTADCVRIQARTLQQL